jgi:hypothetical protein
MYFRRLLMAILLGISVLGPSVSRACPEMDENRRADTIRAATANAVRGLYDEVGRQLLAPNLTIKSYLNTLKAEEDFLRTLQAAEQVGDPRWVKHTVQVQLEIPATRVRDALRQLAAANPKTSPLTDMQIERAARAWPQSVFAATGSAAGKGADLRPRPGSAWEGIAGDVRQRALDDAATDAARRVLQSVKDIPLGEKKTVGDALADEQIAAEMRRWLVSRPMTRVDFQENLDVEVALAADSKELFEVFRVAIENQERLPKPKAAEDWRDIEKDFVAKMAAAVGRARVNDGKVTAVAQRVNLPARPPAWVEKSIAVVGTSPAKGGKLKTSGAAERDAQSKLTERIEMLELNPNLTVGQAARQDQRISTAIARAVKRASPHKFQYNADGSATVYVDFDLRDLWEELRQ